MHGYFHNVKCKRPLLISSNLSATLKKTKVGSAVTQATGVRMVVRSPSGARKLLAPGAEYPRSYGYYMSTISQLFSRPGAPVLGAPTPGAPVDPNVFQVVDVIRTFAFKIITLLTLELRAITY